jgi:hypothetical protein
MTYSTCPNCGVRIGSRDGLGPTRCPRCLARKGERVELTAALRRERPSSDWLRPKRAD